MQLGSSLAALGAGMRCRGCGREGILLCGPCARATPPAHIDPPVDGIDRVLARWAYEGAPRSLVLDLKLRAVRSAAAPLARGCIDTVRRAGSPGRVVTWVPGRPREVRVRGFDHAEEIARRVAAELGLPAIPLLIRRRDVDDQTGLSRAQRRTNVLGAFASRPISTWVVLVDDVVTSGATARSCAAALRAAGCRGVELVAPCRAASG